MLPLGVSHLAAAGGESQRMLCLDPTQTILLTLTRRQVLSWSGLGSCFCANPLNLSPTRSKRLLKNFQGVTDYARPGGRDPPSEQVTTSGALGWLMRVPSGVTPGHVEEDPENECFDLASSVLGQCRVFGKWLVEQVVASVTSVMRSTQSMQEDDERQSLL